MMLKFIDPDHPFYRPLWVRLLIVGFTAGWTAVEFINGQEIWGYIFLALAAYTGAALLVFYKPKDSETKDTETKDTEPGADATPTESGTETVASDATPVDRRDV
jgi:hypothetical protein